jgi:tetratricopeptide (TPR) repeat protein
VSASALQHGEEQVRKMLHDRPEMAEHVVPGDELFTWAARKITGEDTGTLVDWDNTDPKPYPCESGPTGGGHDCIRVSASQGDTDHASPNFFERLWSSAVFELHNVALTHEFDRVAKAVVRREMNRANYILATFSLEEITRQRTRAFYLKVFFPWLRTHNLQTSPENWGFDFFLPTNDKNARLRYWRNDPRWAYDATEYDLMCVAREYRDGNFATVKGLLKSILARQNSHTCEQLANVHYWQGYLDWTNGDLKQAAVEFTSALAAYPKMHAAIFARGQALLDVRRAPERADSYVARGDAWYEKFDFDKAIDDYAEAIHRDPKTANGYVGRGAALAATHEFRTAIADLTTAIRLDPNLTRAYGYRGWAWYQLHAYERAVVDCRQAVRQAPKSAEYQNALAWILATCPDTKVREGKAAVESATKACEITEWKDASTLDTLACALAEAGKFPEAMKRMQQAIHLTETSQKKVNAAFEEHLHLFERRQAFHGKPLQQ